MSDAPACKHCLYFRVGHYTYHCIAPQVVKTKVDPITGHTLSQGQYPERLREDVDRCGPEGRWFEPYPYRVPKIDVDSPGLMTLIICAPLIGFVFLGSLLAVNGHVIMAGILAALVLPISFMLIEMLHSRDDPS